MGLYDNLPDDEDPYPSRGRASSNNKLGDDGVSVSTPNGNQAKEIASTKRVFYWLFSVTFLVVVAIVIICYLYIAFSDAGKDLPATDALVTILKILANILMGLGSE